jgi:two-component system, NarL family, invasion response regulator UvrY
MMTRILLVDDHPVVRLGIRAILTDRIKGVVVGEAGDADNALGQLRTNEWDLVVADLSLPGMSGLDLIKRLRDLYPNLPTLVMSMHPAAQFARRAIGAGATGYLTKDSAPDTLVAAIDDIRRRRYHPGHGAEEIPRRVSARMAATPHDSLSDREYQILRLIGSGHTVSGIARELSLSVKTVSTYRARALEKLGMRTNAELMRYAIENQLLES